MGEAQAVKNGLTILAAIIAVALAIGLYKAKSDAAKARADVQHLQAEIADAQADVRALRAEIARRESPGNVEALARERLGLAPGQGQAPLPERALDQRLPAPETQR